MNVIHEFGNKKIAKTKKTSDKTKITRYTIKNELAIIKVIKIKLSNSFCLYISQ